ncbi:Hypothetical protein SMAX5B_021987 [Scophthalmus maximus]|uniref:Uncharacterized protein n=1 Tax=Scophthalmus maximus TaxID=52904 RepID=A0A2U9CJ73_SCOMX|nr:Hypothetical protein SMAX5B_021987 [Scophthalmus maximus]KAF0044081.1 hypothetical protein F2P81_003239 [Scophthalmus maximus]
MKETADELKFTVRETHLDAADPLTFRKHGCALSAAASWLVDEGAAIMDDMAWTIVELWIIRTVLANI